MRKNRYPRLEDPNLENEDFKKNLDTLKNETL